MNGQTYWQAIGAELDRLETGRPTTAAGVIRVLLELDPMRGEVPGNARHGFFGGSGGDRQLWDSLAVAGWRRTGGNAIHWHAVHPTTGARLEYVEGDVYDRTEAAEVAR